MDLARHELIEAWRALGISATGSGRWRAFRERAGGQASRFLDACAAALLASGRCPPADLSHRSQPVPSYRSGLSGARYEPCILVAVGEALQGHVWMNGEALSHSERTLSAARDLSARFGALARCAEELADSRGFAWTVPRALVGFDSAYFHFERTYLEELVEIE